MFDDFRARHPVVFWVLLVGVILIALWALGGRLFAPNNAQTAQTVETLAGPSDAAIQASTALDIARLNATADAAARADNVLMREEELGVGFRIAELENARGSQADVLNYNLGFHQIDAQTQQVGIAATLQSHLAELGAQTDQAYITANRDISIAGTNAQVAINQQNNKTSRHSSNNGLLGAIGGIIGGLFSDARLKENIFYAHTDPETGLNWYTFNYTQAARARFALPAGTFCGVLAQELLDTRHARHVSRDASGYLRVNYSAINGWKAGRRLAIA